MLGLEVLSHISVERDPAARRVVEAHFPEVVHVEDVALVDESMVVEWSLRFSQASVVLLGSGPPCQGVSGLNAGRKGALRDARSNLFVHVDRITQLVRKSFVWAQVHSLMESVASMDAKDKDHMSNSFGSEPWRIDAAYLTWCARPRYYWVTWELQPPEGSCDGRSIKLEASQDLEDVCKPGWTKVDPEHPFPTFTTSRPRSSPGYKPAGVHQCTGPELKRWEADGFRYPPYQHRGQHGMINRRNEVRLPDIEEKEYMMGFPIH